VGLARGRRIKRDSRGDAGRPTRLRASATRDRGRRGRDWRPGAASGSPSEVHGRKSQNQAASRNAGERRPGAPRGSVPGTPPRRPTPLPSLCGPGSPPRQAAVATRGRPHHPWTVPPRGRSHHPVGVRLAGRAGAVLTAASLTASDRPPRGPSSHPRAAAPRRLSPRPPKGPRR
jgi:hypothetical protein